MADKDMNSVNNYIVGVTGGIGSGKTATTDLFIEYGVEVVDADIIARQVVAPGQPALDEITQAFGAEFLLADGGLNRAKLRELIFSDEQAKSKLNAIMHPAIRNGILNALQQAQSHYVVLSAPLLLENKLQTLVDRVLVIDVSEATQIKRASGRDGVDESQIKQIIASQISRTSRLELADDVIDNNGDLATLKAQALDLHHKYLQLATDAKK